MTQYMFYNHDRRKSPVTFGRYTIHCCVPQAYIFDSYKDAEDALHRYNLITMFTEDDIISVDEYALNLSCGESMLPGIPISEYIDSGAPAHICGIVHDCDIVENVWNSEESEVD